MIASRNGRAVRIVFAAVVASACVTATLTGCSAGQVTQTSSQVPPVPGANADAGPVALRNLVIVYNGPQGYPTGASAALAVRLFNNGTAAVKLVGVSSDMATSVSFIGSGAAPTTAAPTTAATSASPTGTGTATPTVTYTGVPTGTGIPNPSPSTPAPAPAGGPLAITIAPGSFILLVPGQAGGFLRLDGLKSPIVPGGFIPVTFTFDNGTSTKIQVPLAPPTTEVPRASAVAGGE